MFQAFPELVRLMEPDGAAVEDVPKMTFPDENRNRGYATALQGELASQFCLVSHLYTDSTLRCCTLSTPLREARRWLGWLKAVTEIFMDHLARRFSQCMAQCLKQILQRTIHDVARFHRERWRGFER